MSEDKYIFLTNVRPGWSARRPETDIEAEDCDEKKNRRPRTSLRVRRI